MNEEREKGEWSNGRDNRRRGGGDIGECQHTYIRTYVYVLYHAVTAIFNPVKVMKVLHIQ